MIIVKEKPYDSRDIFEKETWLLLKLANDIQFITDEFIPVCNRSRAFASVLADQRCVCFLCFSSGGRGRYLSH